MKSEKSLEETLSGKKVLVVGLGLQGGGVGLIQFLAKHNARVTVTDLKSEEKLKASIEKLKGLDITYHLGTHPIEDFTQADLIFKAPKMRWDAPEIMAALRNNIPVEMETSFFVSMCPAKVIGITGTRGKSTTTHMIYSILKDQDIHCYLAGNIPGSPSIKLLDKVTKDDMVILELSSWQLSGFHQKKVSPQVSIFTNFYPDHLDYYQHMDEYFYDKQAIFAYQNPEDILVANASLRKSIEKVGPVSTVYYVNPDTFPKKLLLQGSHNKENAGLAYETARALNLDLQKTAKTLSEFKGLPNRQEIIGEKNDIVFVNDTTSTTPVAAQTALETFKNDRVVMILGGNAKKLPTADLIDLLAVPEAIILLAGSFTDEILPELKKRFGNKITTPFTDLKLAIDEAYKKAKALDQSDKKTVILFSPAATSFAMFNNEFHRGELFNQTVAEILKADT